MESSHKESKLKKEEGDSEATIQIWKHIFGFSEIAVVKCAIELKIGDAIECYGSPMTLSQLSSALNCSSPLLYRILRFLIRRGIFREETTPENLTAYAQTPLSRLLTTSGESSMAPLFLLENGPVMLAPWHNLSANIKNNSEWLPFEAAHGNDLWSYAAANPTFNALFNEAIACFGRVITVPAILESCGEVFEGVGCLVDVGGGNGTSLSMIVKACPWIRGLNFDLPHVVSTSPEYENVRHVGGNMFDYVPKADAAFFMWILHCWDDEECIKILKNCKEAIPKSRGKVIIVEIVIDEKEKSKTSDMRLMLDMAMMARFKKGKERTADEWAYLLNEAGFSRHTITPIGGLPSLIQAFI
ncbi:desmethylxanthohumol 6'-O-methyltransferase-like [Momordica charantia]|uniref:Desmethylxanthohumol 6'-O-methyltransferase-like n=1 Tax=Momordica charantia TaxID=3673 RepID=A0A6J1C1Q8_MOMCH|nr:desmethylxanthohumol 6'-O-methyltransferase-like [Momordica charantia]